MMLLDRMNGSLQRISDVKANIKRFPVLFNRLNMYMIGGVLLIPFIFYNFFDDEYIKKRSGTLDYEQKIKQQYREYEEIYKRNGRKFPYPDYDHFLDDQITRYYDDFAFYIGSTLVTFLPWFYILFARPGAPVQINRKRQLIYTWHRGKLYAARFEQLKPKCPASAGGWELSGGWGPLVLHLYRAGQVYDEQGQLNKGKKFKVGLYIPTLEWENKHLLRFIEEYLSGQTQLPEDYSSRKGWLEYAVRKPNVLPDDETLEQSIDEWEASEGAASEQQKTLSQQL